MPSRTMQAPGAPAGFGIFRLEGVDESDILVGEHLKLFKPKPSIHPFPRNSCLSYPFLVIKLQHPFSN